MEDESKPWHKAKSGEVWMIRIGGESIPYDPALVQTLFSRRALCFVRGYEEAISVMFWNIQDAYRIHPAPAIEEKKLMETENQNKGPKIRVVEFKDRITVTSYDDQRLPNNTILLSDEVEGVRNYFQKKRDMELGRWRDPENPDMVCYDVSDKIYVDVCVLNEHTGVTKFYGRNDPSLWAYGSTGRTALRYFEAHQPKKPWEKAAQGDIWILTSHGGEVAPYTKIGEKWSREHVIDTYTDDYFIDGYRFWSKL